MTHPDATTLYRLFDDDRPLYMGDRGRRFEQRLAPQPWPAATHGGTA